MIIYGWAKCCRLWPTDMLSPFGRCGLCGERPKRMPLGYEPEDQPEVEEENGG